MKQLCKDNLSNELSVQGIYCIIINDKKYVGSSVNIKNRLKHHIWAMSNNRHHNRTIQNYWNKYKIAKFEILEICNDNILEREKFYIDIIKPYMNHILDPVNHKKDFVYKKRLSDAGKGRIAVNKVKVYMYDLNGFFLREFKSITEASIYFDCDPSGICAVLNNRAKSSNKYLWSLEKVNKLEIPIKNYKTVTILQLDNNKKIIKKWDSLTEAQNKLKISNISRALRKGTKAGTFYWSYE